MTLLELWDIFGKVIYGIYILIVVAGVTGAALCASTREDAFAAADRKPKWTWVGILAASSFVILLNLPFLSWIGIVVIGIYWFDVRPQIKDILNGDYY